jgi:pyruvate/2-oxoacid:ferredoxin oxidoreductase alpha subunit
MQKVLTGNQAVAWGVRLARAQVISAYPITPQTTIIEEISDFINRGEFQAKFIKVESEHSAMSGCISATAAGARTFTATSSQGLALMHEMLHWAGGGRLPIVMANVNRALAPGWTIWCDQNDSLSQRDTGWIQLYCETAQEALDTVIIAYKLAERVLIPVMVNLDAFFLSHTAETVEIPEQREVDSFLPKFNFKYKLDVEKPFAMFGAAGPDIYQEFRYNQQIAFTEALSAFKEIELEYKEKFDYSYGEIELYRGEEAEIILATSGSAVSTAREVVDNLRSQGEKIGLLKLKMFRPFPAESCKRALKNVKKVAVIDRNICPGVGGIWAQELKSALYDMPSNERPAIFSFIAGLGGRDITLQTVTEAFQIIKESEYPKQEIYWLNLKKL